MAKVVVKPYNMGTWSAARRCSQVRSALRRAFMFYLPLQEAKKRARRKALPGSRHKWEYQCACCKQWFKEKEIHIDHKIPCGGFAHDLSDLGVWAQRLISESPDDYQVLCKAVCHQARSDSQKTERKNNKT